MEKKNNYVATYILCNHIGELEAYDVYKKENSNCSIVRTSKDSIEIFFNKKDNVVKLLQEGNIMQISSCYSGIKIQIGILSKEFHTNMPIFKKIYEETGDNVFITLEKLDNRIGNMVYSNKLSYQKEIGGIYEQRFNISNFSRRNG